eukprot:6205224-Pleurochrysis_carterae.AAC.1
MEQGAVRGRASERERLRRQSRQGVDENARDVASRAERVRQRGRSEVEARSQLERPSLTFDVFVEEGRVLRADGGARESKRRCVRSVGAAAPAQPRTRVNARMQFVPSHQCDGTHCVGQMVTQSVSRSHTSIATDACSLLRRR